MTNDARQAPKRFTMDVMIPPRRCVLVDFDRLAQPVRSRWTCPSVGFVHQLAHTTVGGRESLQRDLPAGELPADFPGGDSGSSGGTTRAEPGPSARQVPATCPGQ